MSQNAEIKSFNYGDRVVVEKSATNPLYRRFIISTPNPKADVLGDVVDPAGFDPEEYSKNPVVLFEHGRVHCVPVGVCKSDDGTKVPDIQIFSDRVEAGVIFGEHPEGKTALYLVDNDIVKGASVSLIPKDIAKLNNKGTHFKKWGLREWSITSRPMNSDCWKKSLDGLKPGEDDERIKLVKSWQVTRGSDDASMSIGGYGMYPGEKVIRLINQCFDDVIEILSKEHESKSTDHEGVRKLWANELLPCLQELKYKTLSKGKEWFPDSEWSLGDPLPMSQLNGLSVEVLKSASEAINNMLRNGAPRLLSDRNRYRELAEKLTEQTKSLEQTVDPEVKKLLERLKIKV